MRLRRVFGTGLLGMALLALAAGLTALWPQPLSSRVRSIEPGGMVDDQGNEAWLVDVEIVNHGRRLIFTSQEQQKVAARLAHGWNEIQNRWYAGLLRPASTNLVTLVVPAGTEVFRLMFQYQLEPVRVGLGRRAGFQTRLLAERYLPARIVRSIWPQHIAPSPAGWRSIRLEVPLPTNALQNTTRLARPAKAVIGMRGEAPAAATGACPRAKRGACRRQSA